MPPRNSYSQVAELRIAHRRWSVDHQIHRSRCLRERDYLAEAFGSGQDHDDAIEAEGDAAVRGSAVFEGFEEESEAGAGFLFRHAEGAEDFALNILAMN